MISDPQIKYRNNLFGILFMIVNVLSIATLYAFGKYIYRDINPSQVVFFYKGLLFIMICPWVFSEGFSVIKTPNIWLHVIRGFLSLVGSMCFMHGLKHVGLVSATAMQHLEQVIWVLVGIAVFKEEVNRVKLIAIPLSFIGALFVINPDMLYGNYSLFFSDDMFGYLLICGAIFVWSLNSVIVKILGQRAQNKTQAFYVMFFSAIFAFPIACFKWEVLSTSFGFNLMLPTEYLPITNINLQFEHMVIIVCMSLCYFLHTIAFFNALKYGELSIVTPFVYCQALFSGLYGYFILGEEIKPGFYLGFLLIAFAGIGIIWHESRKNLQSNEAIA